MTHKISALGDFSMTLTNEEKWYFKVAQRTVRIFQAVEHMIMRFLEVDPIYPWRQ